MGYRAHVQTKHEIEYGNCHFNHNYDAIKDWLIDNNVNIHGGDDEEWEIYKEDLKAIPDSAYKTLNEGDEWNEVSVDELRDFVKELLAAPTGDYSHVSWF